MPAMMTQQQQHQQQQAPSNNTNTTNGNGNGNGNIANEMEQLDIILEDAHNDIHADTHTNTDSPTACSGTMYSFASDDISSIGMQSIGNLMVPPPPLHATPDSDHHQHSHHQHHSQQQQHFPLHSQQQRSPRLPRGSHSKTNSSSEHRRQQRPLQTPSSKPGASSRGMPKGICFKRRSSGAGSKLEGDRWERHSVDGGSSTAMDSRPTIPRRRSGHLRGDPVLMKKLASAAPTCAGQHGKHSGSSSSSSSNRRQPAPGAYSARFSGPPGECTNHKQHPHHHQKKQQQQQHPYALAYKRKSSYTSVSSSSYSKQCSKSLDNPPLAPTSGRGTYPHKQEHPSSSTRDDDRYNSNANTNTNTNKYTTTPTTTSTTATPNKPERTPTYIISNNAHSNANGSSYEQHHADRQHQHHRQRRFSASNTDKSQLPLEYRHHRLTTITHPDQQQQHYNSKDSRLTQPPQPVYRRYDDHDDDFDEHYDEDDGDDPLQGQCNSQHQQQQLQEHFPSPTSVTSSPPSHLITNRNHQQQHHHQCAYDDPNIHHHHHQQYDRHHVNVNGSGSNTVDIVGSSLSHLDNHRRPQHQHHHFNNTHNVTTNSNNTTATTTTPKQPVEVEIAPDVWVELRGAEETWDAVATGYYCPTTCMECQIQLLCVLDAQSVLCPCCRVVSPILDDPTGMRSSLPGFRGVGLGFTPKELLQWQKDLQNGVDVRQSIIMAS